MKVIGCSIFRAEVEHVLGEEAVAAWLPAGLHVSDERLGAALAEALGTGDGTLCLYGACHPDIDAMLEKRGGRRLAAQSCIEAFLDPAERAQLPEGAFIMSPGWLREWRSIFVDGMSWDEIDGRINFGPYDVVVILDFGLEPIDDIAVLEFFDFTQTPVEVIPASLDWFRQRIAELLDG